MSCEKEIATNSQVNGITSLVLMKNFMPRDCCPVLTTKLCSPQIIVDGLSAEAAWQAPSLSGCWSLSARSSLSSTDPSR